MQISKCIHITILMFLSLFETAFAQDSLSFVRPIHKPVYIDVWGHMSYEGSVSFLSEGNFVGSGINIGGEVSIYDNPFVQTRLGVGYMYSGFDYLQLQQNYGGLNTHWFSIDANVNIINVFVLGFKMDFLFLQTDKPLQGKDSWELFGQCLNQFEFGPYFGWGGVIHPNLRLDVFGGMLFNNLNNNSELLYESLYSGIEQLPRFSYWGFFWSVRLSYRIFTTHQRRAY